MHSSQSIQSSSLRVGIIGLGLMGTAMAQCLISNGFTVSVLAHRKREAIDALVSQGAIEERSAETMARNADVILISVTGTPQVRDVFMRDQGLLAGAHAGLVVIDSSTVDPGFAHEAHELLQAHGARFLDSPVNRTPKEARKGCLNALVGGDTGTLDAVRPVLECITESIYHLGGLGAGYRAKLIHNFVSQANIAILAEAFGTASTLGLDLNVFADLCRMSGAHSRAFDRVIPYVLEGDDSGQQFTMRNALKDMRGYTQLTTDASTVGGMASAASQLYLLATQLGHGDEYVARLFDVVGRLNGTEVHV